MRNSLKKYTNVSILILMKSRVRGKKNHPTMKKTSNPSIVIAVVTMRSFNNKMDINYQLIDACFTMSVHLLEK
jgi:hypothetical protein